MHFSKYPDQCFGQVECLQVRNNFEILTTYVHAHVHDSTQLKHNMLYADTISTEMLIPALDDVHDAETKKKHL